MTINTTPAAADLTAHGNYSKGAERAAIIRGKRAFLKAGGIIGVYRHGAAWNAPSGARRMLPHMNREVFASPRDYVEAATARKAASEAAKTAAMEAARREREARASGYAGSEEQSEMAMMHGDEQAGTFH